jgi:hypothetical protein
MRTEAASRRRRAPERRSGVDRRGADRSERVLAIAGETLPALGYIPTTPDSGCSPSEIATIHEANAILLASSLLREARQIGESNAWAMETWLRKIADEHFSDKLTKPLTIATASDGVLSGVFTTGSRNVRVLIDPRFSDECTTLAQVQHIYPELLDPDNPRAGVSLYRSGTLSYGTLFAAMLSTIGLL